MDPLSITAACTGILSSLTALSLEINRFIRAVREARKEMDAVSREISSLSLCLQTLHNDCSTDAVQYPPQLQRSLVALLTNCDNVTKDMAKVLDVTLKSRLGPNLSWTTSGSSEVDKLRVRLEAHKASIEIALEMVSMFLIRGVKEDTIALKGLSAAIKDDTEQIPSIKQDTIQIASLVHEIHSLRLQVSSLEQRGDNLVLQRFLAESTSYAESACDITEQVTNSQGGLRTLLEIQDGTTLEQHIQRSPKSEFPGEDENNANQVKVTQLFDSFSNIQQDVQTTFQGFLTPIESGHNPDPQMGTVEEMLEAPKPARVSEPRDRMQFTQHAQDSTNSAEHVLQDVLTKPRAIDPRTADRGTRESQHQDQVEVPLSVASISPLGGTPRNESLVAEHKNPASQEECPQVLPILAPSVSPFSPSNNKKFSSKTSMTSKLGTNPVETQPKSLSIAVASGYILHNGGNLRSPSPLTLFLQGTSLQPQRYPLEVDTRSLPTALASGFSPKDHGAIHLAAYRGDEAILKLLLQHGGDPNEPGDLTSTVRGPPLHIAVVRPGFDNIVAILLEAGADPNVRPPGNFSNTFLATYYNYTDKLQYLIDHGANISESVFPFGSLLHLAAAAGNVKTVQILLTAGIDPNSRNGKWLYPLCAAAALKSSSQRLAICRLLLKEGARSDVVCGTQSTPLHYAVISGDLQLVRLLVENGANVNVTCSEHGTVLETAMSVPPKKVMLSLASFLVESGAQVKETMAGHQGPLIAALSTGTGDEAEETQVFETIKYLLRAGAPINHYGGVYQTAIQAAAWHGRTRVVEHLLKYGADVLSMRGGEEETPLHAAALYGEPRIVSLLLERGARAEIVSDRYGTALHAAVAVHKDYPKNDKSRAVRAIIASGIDVNAVDIQGKTALHVAASLRQSNVPDESASRLINILILAGANVNKLDRKFHTALAYARWNKSHTGVKRLLDAGADPNLGHPIWTM